MTKVIFTISIIIYLIIFPEISFSLPSRLFELAFPGTEMPVDYEKYGEFRDVGTPEYEYVITDKKGLSRAVGEGIYPNRDIYRDPRLESFLKAEGRVDVWAHTGGGDPRKAFFAWADVQNQDPGVKLYFTAEALRRAGLIPEAVKTYYALVVHFPRTVIWSADGSFYWHVAPEAIARIRKLCATHTDLGLQLEGAFVEIDKGKENSPESDTVRTWPGHFVKKQLTRVERDAFQITQVRGGGRVRVVKYNDAFWELELDGKPFVVKGVTYASTKVGESAHALNLRPWMTLDDNRNARNDGLFDSWIDKNKNNRQEDDERPVGDAYLLYVMGANALRIYHGVDAWGRYDPKEYDKDLMRSLNRDHGIFFIMGDFLGAYTVGSLARWDIGTDYTDEEQKTRMMEAVKAMVLDHKDEPYVLMWLLGNENQHPFSRTNAHENPEAFARFLNDVAKMIHAIDPDHPVAVCNLNFQGLRELSQFAPEVDVYGANVYSGAYSMGSVWQRVKKYYDRPVLITEMGADAYSQDKGPDEKAQAHYFLSNWEDIELNKAGNTGEGNAIGGVYFEWIDEWWKSTKGDSWGDPFEHNTQGDSHNAPFPDHWSHEEWCGIFGQGNGKHSPFLREPRKIYETIKKIWTGTD